jgi:hypothetical protein
MHTNLKGVHVPYFFNGGIPTSQWRGVALHEQHKSDKELPFLVFFFSYCFRKYAFGQERRDTGRQAPHITALGGYPD